MAEIDFPNENNVIDLLEDGALLNTTDDTFILLHGLPSVEQIRDAHAHFKEAISKHLLWVLSTPMDELEQEVGSLRRSDSTISANSFASLSHNGTSLIYCQAQPLVLSLSEMGYISNVTVRGDRRRTSRQDGSLPEVMAKLTPSQVRELMTYADTNFGWDAVLRPKYVAGLSDVQKLVMSNRSAQSMLSTVADNTHARLADGAENVPAGWAWFAEWLCREGVWIQPFSHVGNLSSVTFSPFNYLWIDVFCPSNGGWPTLARSAWQLWRNGSRAAESEVLAAYRQLLHSTNASQSERLSLGPFAALRTIHLDKNQAGRATGFNVLARLACKAFGTELLEMEEAQLFEGRRRLSSQHGINLFAWVDRPTPRNTQRYQELVGSPPPTFPDYLRQWAGDFRELFPLLQAKSTNGPIDALNLFLLYLAELGEERAPKCLAEIVRGKHINSLGNPAHFTFMDFLGRVGCQPDRKNTALTRLAQVWVLASKRDGFGSRLTCPIDRNIDEFGRSTRRRARTHRKAIDQDILSILMQENRRDDYAFGRSLGRYDRVVFDHEVGEASTEFWPAVPILFDLIFSTGMRKSSALWLDSAEGDECWPDPETLAEMPNPLATAEKRRKAGFLRIMEIAPGQRVLGMHLEVNKTGAYAVPYVDPAAARQYVKMRNWQLRFNPANKPIPALRGKEKHLVDHELVASVYPVFRDPQSGALMQPPGDDQVNRYWVALLKHCQPLANKAIGYDYPLVLDETQPRWDIHSLRVTVVSVLLDNGVPIHVVQMLVGHASPMMTWHYKAIDLAAIHRSIQEGFEYRKFALSAERLSTLDEDEVEAEIVKVVGQRVTLRSNEDWEGISLLKDNCGWGAESWEMFAHGICPGGGCNTGGEYYKNVYQPVFRPRACSRCRYRITGPAFLNGLVLRLNALMVEIKQSMNQEAELEDEIVTAEDNGRPTVALRGAVGKLREARDALFAEWCAELRTIHACESLLSPSDGGAHLPMITGMPEAEARTRLSETHFLNLMHMVIRDASVVSGGSADVPPGTREMRDELLMRVARTNGVEGFFYRMDDRTRRKALDRFGDLLLGGTPSEVVQDLIDGDLRFDGLPELDATMADFLEQLKDPASLLERGSR